MAYGYDELEYGPLRGRALSETEQFLAEQGLSWEQDVTYTVLLRDGEGRIAATASLQMCIRDRSIIHLQLIHYNSFARIVQGTEYELWSAAAERTTY